MSPWPCALTVLRVLPGEVQCAFTFDVAQFNVVNPLPFTAECATHVNNRQHTYSGVLMCANAGDVMLRRCTLCPTSPTRRRKSEGVRLRAKIPMNSGLYRLVRLVKQVPNLTHRKNNEISCTKLQRYRVVCTTKRTLGTGWTRSYSSQYCR